MNNAELDTLIVLKYGTLAIYQEYIKGLPEPVSKRLNNGWPFITVEDVYTALVAYEKGEEIPMPDTLNWLTISKKNNPR